MTSPWFSAPDLLDVHDRRLLEAVRPADWVRPSPADRYHLLVLGGGTGGLVTAAVAAALGARVALVERGLLGGDCLNVGCVPSKALIEAARGWQGAREVQERFSGPGTSSPGDFAGVMERMRRIRSEMSPHDGAGRFRDLGVDVFFGSGRFTAPDRLEVDGLELRFRRAVIATGGRPALPPIPGLAEAEPLTNETVFSIRALPSRLAVIGGGAIGCELAQAMARFGSRVTLLEAQPRILSREDPEASEVVAGVLTREGVDLRPSVRIERILREGEVRQLILAGESSPLMVDAILVAAGRVPNVEGMGAEVAGVAIDPRRGILTDPRMRTTNRRIFAIGDVASAHGFTHAADAQARLVVRNALFGGRASSDRLLIPRCTYTEPEVAHVGAGAGAGVETLSVAIGSLDRARLAGQEEGFIRIHLAPGTDRIRGATIVAPHAGELISQMTQAMQEGIGLGSLSSVIMPYPTLAEGIRRLGDQVQRRRFTPRVAWLLRLWLRFSMLTR